MLYILLRFNTHDHEILTVLAEDMEKLFRVSDKDLALYLKMYADIQKHVSHSNYQFARNSINLTKWVIIF